MDQRSSIDEEKELWETIAAEDSDAWWTVDRDDSYQFILYIGHSTVDEFLDVAEKSFITSVVQPIQDEFKFSHVKVQFEKDARKPALLPLKVFRPMSSFLGREHLSNCITADQFVEAWNSMLREESNKRNDIYEFSESESESNVVMVRNSESEDHKSSSDGDEASESGDTSESDAEMHENSESEDDKSSSDRDEASESGNNSESDDTNGNMVIGNMVIVDDNTMSESDTPNNNASDSQAQTKDNTAASKGESQSKTKNNAAASEGESQSKTKNNTAASKGESQSKTKNNAAASKGESQSKTKNNAAASKGESQSKTKDNTAASKGESQSKTKDNTAASKGESQSKTKNNAAASKGESQSKTKDNAAASKGESQSKTKDNTAASKGESQSKTKAAASKGESQSKTKDNTAASKGESQSKTKAAASKGESQSKTKDNTAASKGESQSKTKAAASKGESQSKTKDNTAASKGESQSKTKDNTAASEGESQSKTKDNTAASKGESQSKTKDNTAASEGESQSKTKDNTAASEGESQSKTKDNTAASKGESQEDGDQKKLLLEAADLYVGEFRINIEQLHHPSMSRQVRALNETHVERLKKSFLAAGSLTFQSAGSLIGLVSREDCQSVEDFDAAKLSTYTVEIIDGNHRLEAQRRALIEATSQQREMFSQTKVALYVGLQDDSCLAAGIYCNDGKEHMEMSDMDMTKLFRNILLRNFLHSTEENLKTDSDLAGPKDYFSHIRDNILQLPARVSKKEDLKKKFDTFRLRLRIAQLSPRCYSLVMEFFVAEKARGRDMKASNFKWIQAMPENEIYELLSKATEIRPVTLKELKKAAAEAERKKKAKVMDKCQMTLKGTFIELMEGGRRVTYKRMEVTTGRKSRIWTAKELQACLSGETSSGKTSSPSKRRKSAQTNTGETSSGKTTSPSKRRKSAQTDTGETSSGKTSSPSKRRKSAQTDTGETSSGKTSSPSKRRKSAQTDTGETSSGKTSSPAKQMKKSTRKLTREEQYEAAREAMEQSSPSANKEEPYFEDVRLEIPSVEVGDIVLVDPGKKQYNTKDPWLVVVMDVKRSTLTVKFLSGEFGKAWDVSPFDTTPCDLKKVVAKLWFDIFPLGTKKMPESIEEKVKNLHGSLEG
ncbi:TTC16 [Branchiostoma lanceolatum]|uniref:TTC16 protein n=1 Tax=Branchiostoma lanceolatum TaxID=7740 RepID=A0A8J9ZED8_BRALA|nr:TTC16 [Branchiostoma lanceolatum]